MRSRIALQIEKQDCEKNENFYLKTGLPAFPLSASSACEMRENGIRTVFSAFFAYILRVFYSAVFCPNAVSIFCVNAVSAFTEVQFMLLFEDAF